jgi:hypothetical protein
MENLARLQTFRTLLDPQQGSATTEFGRRFGQFVWPGRSVMNIADISPQTGMSFSNLLRWSYRIEGRNLIYSDWTDPYGPTADEILEALLGEHNEAQQRLRSGSAPIEGGGTNLQCATMTVQSRGEAAEAKLPASARNFSLPLTAAIATIPVVVGCVAAGLSWVILRPLAPVAFLTSAAAALFIINTVRNVRKHNRKGSLGR